MKTKEYVKKYELDKSDKFSHNEFGAFACSIYYNLKKRNSLDHLMSLDTESLHGKITTALGIYNISRKPVLKVSNLEFE